MIGNIIAAIVIGIIAGYLGRALLPGDDSMGFIATVAAASSARSSASCSSPSCSASATTDKFDLGASSARSSA